MLRFSQIFELFHPFKGTIMNLYDFVLNSDIYRAIFYAIRLKCSGQPYGKHQAQFVILRQDSGREGTPYSMIAGSVSEEPVNPTGRCHTP